MVKPLNLKDPLRQMSGSSMCFTHSHLLY